MYAKTCTLSRRVSLTGTSTVFDLNLQLLILSIHLTITFPCDKITPAKGPLSVFFTVFQPHLIVFMSSWNVSHVITSGDIRRGGRSYPPVLGFTVANYFRKLSVPIFPERKMMSPDCLCLTNGPKLKESKNKEKQKYMMLGQAHFLHLCLMRDLNSN